MCTQLVRALSARLNLPDASIEELLGADAAAALPEAQQLQAALLFLRRVLCYDLQTARQFREARDVLHATGELCYAALPGR